MRSVRVTAASAAAILAVVSVPAAAQEAADQLPPVEVIQQQPAPAPAAKKKSASKKKSVSPSPQAPAAVTAPASVGPERSADGRVVSNAPDLSPISPSTGVLPTDLEGYGGAGTRVTGAQIDEQRPKDNLELLSRVPGVSVVYDDALGRHANVGVRGSPMRRSRKVLVMEDGQSINFSSYIDPSTHYTPPTDRVEAVEVIRGYNIPYGPLTNHGVINFQNLSPFGPDETVISGALGYTEGANKSVNNTRHVHTRQSAGHVGAVVSYSGGDAGGAWDNEVLRYNDFYGALGWKGSNQDLTISGVYFRQRDNYDESNFEGTEAAFFANGRSKAYLGGGYEYNTYNADLFRLQLAHNLYLTDDVTVSTRLYGADNERDRFQARRNGPDVPNGYMRGRERRYEYWGAESRVEFANQAFLGSMTQDIQAGVRYEHHNFRNCNSVGLRGQVLKGHSGGNCYALQDAEAANVPGGFDQGNGTYRESGQFEKYEADAFSAFIQTAIHVTRDLTVTPGVRFENYDVTRDTLFRAQSGNPPPGPRPLTTEKSNHDHVLPGIAVAWEFLSQSTLYGGYQRGFTPAVARGEVMPLPDEIGDNYQIGVRSTSIPGLTFDAAYFHSRIDNYQIKSPFTDPNTGNNVYGTVREVEINGFELYTRLDSHPFVRGHLNFFGEATYTFADSVITESVIAAEVGNYLPEVPRHFATLTLGVEEKGLWDASVSWSHLGGFYTNTLNTPYGGDPNGINGFVPDVWLLSARANYTIPGTETTLFVAGQNLTDEFYIADRSDGMKPGVGRTLWTGFTMKLQ